jgi:hypothetical protein
MALKYGPFSAIQHFVLDTGVTGTKVKITSADQTATMDGYGVLSGTFTAIGGIQAMQYSIDNGAWVAVPPSAYTHGSSGTFSFLVDFNGQTVGHHKVTVKAIDAGGGSDTDFKNMWYGEAHIIFSKPNWGKGNQPPNPYDQSFIGLTVSFKGNVSNLIRQGTIIVEACTDFDAVAMSGTWVNITSFALAGTVWNFPSPITDSTLVAVRLRYVISEGGSPLQLDGFAYMLV